MEYYTSVKKKCTWALWNDRESKLQNVLGNSIFVKKKSIYFTYIKKQLETHIVYQTLKKSYLKNLEQSA